MNVGLVLGSILGGLALYSQLYDVMNPLLALVIMVVGIAFVNYAYYRLSTHKKE
jgi:amino acid transporter